MKKLWSAGVYYYGTSEIVRNTIKVSMQFASTIDTGAMRKVLDMTQKRYPYFSIKMVKTDKEIMLEDNELPWVLKEGEEPIELGGRESNFHMIAFRYKENWLYIDAFHGMSDGKGLMNMFRTLIYYYCRAVYDENINPGDAWLVESPILPEEVEDPYLKLPPRTESVGKASSEKKTEYMNLAEENKYERTKPYVFRMEFPQKELMKYCGENDGSPATAIALFAARAIKKIHKDSEKMIGCGIATDLRKALGTKRSHQSTLTIPILEFTEKIANSEFELQGTAFRGQVLLKCDADALMDGIYASNTLYRFIDSLPTIEEKEKTMQNIVKMKFRGPTASVSYVGRSNFGECEKYIKQLFMEVPGTGVMLELASLNDIFCLTFIQEWEERIYFDMFCKELEECGITYTLKSEGPLEISRIK